MLSYAFRVLTESNYENIETEPFENIHDLFASILATGMNKQLKQGLYKEYITKHESRATLKGKLDLEDTIKHKINHQQLLACEFDELSINNPFNQIIKLTSKLLLTQKNVKNKTKTSLKKMLLFLNNVDDISPKSIHWNTLKFHRNNRHYKMLLNICYLVLDGLLLTETSGEQKMATFLKERNMANLFERFVLEYYRYHHPSLKAQASQVKWDIDEGVIDFLPIMQTDITLNNKDKVLIIDTKFYSKSMQTRKDYDSHKLHSNNLYQIFTYVKNRDVENTGNVSGLLLYAKTDEIITPDSEFVMGGNPIKVKTIDLNVSFQYIKEQLDKIVKGLY